MRVLGIETSCDETGVALYEAGFGIRAERLASQIPIHAAYGGVVPELASRRHLEMVLPVVDEGLWDSPGHESALSEAKRQLQLIIVRGPREIIRA